MFWRKQKRIEELEKEIDRLELDLSIANNKITQLEQLIPDDDGFCHTEECTLCQHYRKGGDAFRALGILSKYSVCELSPHFCKHFK